MPPMSSLPRIVSVLLGIILAAPVASPRRALAQPGDRPGEKADEATRLNDQAQQKFADGRYAEAAGIYARILEVLPENRVNLEERDNTLLIALEVYREAYKKQRVAGDKEATRNAAKLLCTADGLYQRYLTTYRDVYGGAMNPSKAALASNDELQALMRDAEAALGAPPCEPVIDEGPELPAPPEPPPPPDPPRGPNGIGLIVAGAVTMTFGLGATSMIVIGGINRRKAQTVLDRGESEDATEAEMMSLASEKKLARENQSRANGLIIGGSVLTAVLLASGATMLGIGVRRRLSYIAFAPEMGRGYVGVSLQGRF